MLLKFDKKTAYLQCCFLTYGGGGGVSAIYNTWNPKGLSDVKGEDKK